MFEKRYLELVRDVLYRGQLRDTRNGKTIGCFAKTLTFNLDEFPMLTTRKYPLRGPVGEFAAFIRGPKNIKDFEEFGCNYWKDWANKETGEIKVDYGNLWIDFDGVNQLQDVVETIKTNPTDRRLLITGWRPGADVDLPCCHMLYQFYVREDKYIDLIWTQRSVDVMLGLPADAILAALLVSTIANETGYKPGRVHMNFGDTHIYLSHADEAKRYLQYAESVAYQDTKVVFSLAEDTTTTNFVPDKLKVSVLNAKFEAPKFNFKLIV